MSNEKVLPQLLSSGYIKLPMIMVDDDKKMYIGTGRINPDGIKAYYAIKANMNGEITDATRIVFHGGMLDTSVTADDFEAWFENL